MFDLYHRVDNTAAVCRRWCISSRALVEREAADQRRSSLYTPCYLRFFPIILERTTGFEPATLTLAR